jgi:hypothetical protein
MLATEHTKAAQPTFAVWRLVLVVLRVLGCGTPDAGTSHVRHRRPREASAAPLSQRVHEFHLERASFGVGRGPGYLEGNNSTSDADLTIDTVRVLPLWSPNCLGAGGRAEGGSAVCLPPPPRSQDDWL